VDPLHLSIALGPLAVYLLLLGLINLSSRPQLTTGARDTAALGVAVSGFVVAGPMELFLPERAAAHLGGAVWLLLLALYGLTVCLLVLMLRPRLVIYNASVEQIRPTLLQVIAHLDGDARWVGDSVIMPHLGVQLHVEPFFAMRTVQLVSSGPRQIHAGWRALESALAEALRKTSSPPSPYGLSLVLLGLLMVALMTFSVVQDTPSVAQALSEMLRQ
jgi:hypothetical protein